MAEVLLGAEGPAVAALEVLPLSESSRNLSQHKANRIIHNYFAVRSSCGNSTRKSAEDGQEKHIITQFTRTLLSEQGRLEQLRRLITDDPVLFQRLELPAESKAMLQRLSNFKCAYDVEQYKDTLFERKRSRLREILGIPRPEPPTPSVAKQSTRHKKEYIEKDTKSRTGVPPDFTLPVYERGPDWHVAEALKRHQHSLSSIVSSIHRSISNKEDHTPAYEHFVLTSAPAKRTHKRAGISRSLSAFQPEKNTKKVVAPCRASEEDLGTFEELHLFRSYCNSQVKREKIASSESEPNILIHDMYPSSRPAGTGTAEPGGHTEDVEGAYEIMVAPRKLSPKPVVPNKSIYVPKTLPDDSMVELQLSTAQPIFHSRDTTDNEFIELQRSRIPEDSAGTAEQAKEQELDDEIVQLDILQETPSAACQRGPDHMKDLRHSRSVKLKRSNAQLEEEVRAFTLSEHRRDGRSPAKPTASEAHRSHSEYLELTRASRNANSISDGTLLPKKHIHYAKRSASPRIEDQLPLLREKKNIVTPLREHPAYAELPSVVQITGGAPPQQPVRCSEDASHIQEYSQHERRPIVSYTQVQEIERPPSGKTLQVQEGAPGIAELTHIIHEKIQEKLSKIVLREDKTPNAQCCAPDGVEDTVLSEVDEALPDGYGGALILARMNVDSVKPVEDDVMGLRPTVIRKENDNLGTVLASARCGKDDEVEELRTINTSIKDAQATSAMVEDGGVLTGIKDAEDVYSNEVAPQPQIPERHKNSNLLKTQEIELDKLFDTGEAPQEEVDVDSRIEFAKSIGHATGGEWEEIMVDTLQERQREVVLEMRGRARGTLLGARQNYDDPVDDVSFEVISENSVGANQ